MPYVVRRLSAGHFEYIAGLGEWARLEEAHVYSQPVATGGGIVCISWLQALEDEETMRIDGLRDALDDEYSDQFAHSDVRRLLSDAGLLMERRPPSPTVGVPVESPSEAVDTPSVSAAIERVRAQSTVRGSTTAYLFPFPWNEACDEIAKALSVEPEEPPSTLADVGRSLTDAIRRFQVTTHLDDVDRSVLDTLTGAPRDVWLEARPDDLETILADAEDPEPQDEFVAINPRIWSEPIITGIETNTPRNGLFGR